MFTGLKDQSERKNVAKVAIGYDLGKTASQISYCALNAKEVETVSSVAGTEQYNIPTVLCKRSGVNQWFYGKEALKYAKEENGVLVEDLLTLAERGEEVIVEGESYDPAALLTLYVKRSLSLLNMRVSLDQIQSFMFTVEDLTPRMVDVLSKVAAGLSLKANHILFQSYVESFYYYMLHQSEDLWKYNVMIFDYTSKLKSICLECNRKTTPQVVFINSNGYPNMTRMSWNSDGPEKEQQKTYLDKEFLRIAQAEMEGSMFSTVYLLGDGFKEDWASESLRYLCRNRRVFQGNNLYSRGACYGALERICPSEEGKSYVYLGADKLKSNVGMKVLRRGEDSYFAILDAGTNWYEVAADFEVILEEGNAVDFIITPLTGENVMYKRITLDGLPERPKNTSRLRFHIEMTAVNQVTATIEDMGFGEIFPSSGKGWTQTITV
ncbi:MAG: hypothetical protein HDR71_00685 [Lachnospiraceae bacterium]|nr:hypothetical protein [Lachnospiraceae bacterium]